MHITIVSDEVSNNSSEAQHLSIRHNNVSQWRIGKTNCYYYMVSWLLTGAPEQRYWQNRETANVGLDSSVGRAPARQSGGRRFKSRSSWFVFVHPNLSKICTHAVSFPCGLLHVIIISSICIVGLIAIIGWYFLLNFLILGRHATLVRQFTVALMFFLPF